MERFDIRANERLSEMVSAARAGADVEIMADGIVVARVVSPPVVKRDAGGQMFIERLAALHRKLPPELLGGNVAAEIRAMRDED